MNKKLSFFLDVYIVLGFIIFLVMNKNMSDIYTNKNNIFSEYLEMKEIIDLYSYKLPDCVEISAVLTKNLNDDTIKRYEKIELDYYIKKEPLCVKSINDLIGNLGEILKDLKFDEEQYKKIKLTQEKKKILKENLEKVK